MRLSVHLAFLPYKKFAGQEEDDLEKMKKRERIVKKQDHKLYVV